MSIERLIEKANNNERQAQAELCLAYYLGRDIKLDNELGTKWLRKLANAESTVDSVLSLDSIAANPTACFNLYVYWSNTAEASDIVKAHAFLIASAENGYPLAQYFLGNKCEKGENLPPQYCGRWQAEHWLTTAAENGYLDAHESLYQLFTFNECHLDKSAFEKAFYHMSQSVEHGGYRSAYQLAMLFLKGLGTQRNPIQATKWLFIHQARSKDPLDCETLQSVKTELSDADYLQAKTEAIQWLTLHPHAGVSKNDEPVFVDPISGEILDIIVPQNEAATINDSREAAIELSEDQTKTIAAWHQYCSKGIIPDDDCLFYSLLYEDPRLSDENLADVFQYYEHKDELMRRYRLACEVKFDRTNPTLSLKEVETNVRADLLSQYTLSQAITGGREPDKFDLELIKNAPIRLVRSSKQFDEVTDYSSPSWELFDILEELQENYIDSDNITGYSGLCDALRGMFSHVFWINYILTPYATENLNFQPFVNVESAKVNYFLTFDELIIYVNPRCKLVS